MNNLFPLISRTDFKFKIYIKINYTQLQLNNDYKIIIKNLIMNGYLFVSGAVFFNGPTGFITESFQDLVVVTVFRQFVVTVHSQA